MELQSKKISNESLVLKVNKILGKNKRLFNVKFLDKKFEFSLKKEVYEFERKIAGKFLIETNTDLSPNEVMREYKNLQTVENGFDYLKNNLNIRPIFHRKDKRVEAHVFVCVLALLVERIVEKFTKDTAHKVFNEVKSVMKVELNSKDFKRTMITKIPDKTIKYFNELKIPTPIC